MGQCNYYLKARFRDTAAASAALPRLTALLTEGEQAYQYWQDSRKLGGGPRASAAEFWATFRKRFPRVIRYLRELADTPDWGNALAGRMGCLVTPGEEPDAGASLVQNGDLLLLQLNQIWHFTNMALLERYCREELGAIGVGSVSEEDFSQDDEEEDDTDLDPFDAIRL